MKAIIIDDSRSMRALLRGFLEPWGFEVTEAADGREASRVLGESGPFEVCLLDWNMPIMTGYELLILLRASPKFDSMPILMVTTEADAAQMRQALEAGANEYLAKPVTEDELRDKLRAVGFSV